MLCVLHTWRDGSGCHAVSVSTNHPCAFELLLCCWIVLNAIQHGALCAFYAMLPLLQHQKAAFRLACMLYVGMPVSQPLPPLH
jgi:hypothetical protein